MNVELLIRNWGLLLGGLLLLVASVYVGLAMLRHSPRARLQRHAKTLKAARRRRASADRALAVAERRWRRLAERGDSIKPKVLDEAAASVEDAKSLQKIAHDNVLIAVAVLRELIFDEVPPAQQVAFRSRYLGADDPEQPWV